MEAFLGETQHLKIKLEEIKSATNNFDNNNVIGKGGFGKVYKGVLSHSKGESILAFKRLDRKYGQGDPEFLKEILMLSRYSHENLISLLGFCDEDDEKILVYEHAYHGSLDRHLSANTLTWLKRLKICLAVARGLCYLHDPKGTEQRVIHRDIKSSNVLLDESWNAKLSDMGLSKIGPANQQHSFLATNVVGTFGYIDPLYMETYFLTKESDVYSFGMVLFEVLCGRLCFEYNNGHFRSLWPMWKKCYEENKLGQIIFEDLKEQMHTSSLETFSNIAYKCLRKAREERPKMSHVVEELEIAFHIQKTEGPVDFEEMIETEVPPHVYKSKEELQMLLYRGMLVNWGKTESFKKCCNQLLEEERGTWPDLLIQVLCDEWTKCKTAIQALSPLKEPKSILFQTNKPSSSDVIPDESSFAAAQTMYKRVKVFVLLHQLEIFSAGKSLPDQPFILPPADFPENSRAKSAGLNVIGPDLSTELNLVDAVGCKIVFERGNTRQFSFLPISIGTSGWMILAEELPQKPQYGIARVVAPLAGCKPRIDERHSRWLHLRIRPSTLPLSETAESAANLTLKSKSLADGRWTLGFIDEASCKSALTMILEELDLQCNEVARRLTPLIPSEEI